MTGKRKRAAPATEPCTIQVVTGSYERVLHGFTATTILENDEETNNQETRFIDSFMFNAHASAIRCLALSPESSSKRILASGGTDERVNLYQLSTRAPLAIGESEVSSSLGVSSAPRRNKELGTLLNHNQAVTALSFPRHSKLLSASTDNNIAVTRTRDWQLLSTIHVPIPKPTGRPSGDTFAPGEVPAGINDLAVHPSARLALTVGVGEKCMRLWNLVTGKKAAVLTFEKALLAEIGEAKFRGGEARRVVWRPDGLEFAVAFEKGLFVYHMNGQVHSIISLGQRSRVCQARYVPVADGAAGHDHEDAEFEAGKSSLLAVSTEDGRILFYDTTSHLEQAAEQDEEEKAVVPQCKAVAQLGQNMGPGNRIKDFDILSHAGRFYIVTAGSTGTIRVWSAAEIDLTKQVSAQQQQPTPSKKKKANGVDAAKNVDPKSDAQTPQIGTLHGTYETNRRITCMVAFVMASSSGVDENEDGPDVDRAKSAPASRFANGNGVGAAAERSEADQDSDSQGGGEEDDDDEESDGVVIQHGESGESGESSDEGDGSDDFGGFDD